MSELVNIAKEVMADAARLVHQSWSPEDGHDELFGDGGICSEIARIAVGIFEMEGYDAEVVSHANHDHVKLLIEGKEYVLDIPAEVYEEGSGSKWFKKDVEITPNDVQAVRPAKKVDQVLHINEPVFEGSQQ